jgi:hypothetical protein
MSDNLYRLGPVNRELAERLRRESLDRIQARARFPRLAPALQGGLR